MHVCILNFCENCVTAIPNNQMSTQAEMSATVQVKNKLKIFFISSDKTNCCWWYTDCYNIL